MAGPARPPPSFYFSGIIGLDEADPTVQQHIDVIIEREKPGFGFGALAAGADILIAEALHKAGAELHIILPYPVDRFREFSVAPFGEQWIARFDTLVEAAATLEVLTELPDEEERSLAVAVQLADLVAMGQCARNAAVLKSLPKALTITGRGDEPRRQHLVSADTGHDQFAISVTRKADHHSIAKHLESETKEIAAILWVNNIDRDALSLLPSSASDFRSDGDAGYIISTNLAELTATSRSLLQHDADSRISLLTDIIDPQKPVVSLLEQASDMAHASRGGAVLTDHKSAMLLMLQSGEHVFEEIGEL